MGSIYYTDLVEVLNAAGVLCAVEPVNEGWQTRARGSGGFAAPPLAVFWHHTASETSPQNDLAYMIDGSPDEPVGNMLIDRQGVVWPIAAGASNCAGKGGPASFSRGTIGLDNGNATGWQIEVANNGVGEVWPQAQIDAYFAASNALNAHFGNQPTDVISHALGAGDGWTSRKVDPAGPVEGPWHPASVNSSQTWSLNDIRIEAANRAGVIVIPPVEPPPVEPPPTKPPSGYVEPPFPGTGDYGCSALVCRSWQDAMILNGIIADNAANHDGVWGDGMHNACFNMQRSWGWSDADGIGGKHTWSHLRSRKVAPCPKCGK